MSVTVDEGTHFTLWTPPASRSEAAMVAVGFSPRKLSAPNTSRSDVGTQGGRLAASLRDAVAPGLLRGLKPTATITLSLRDCQNVKCASAEGPAHVP